MLITNLFSFSAAHLAAIKMLAPFNALKSGSLSGVTR